MIILKDQLRKYDIGYDIECQHDLWVGVDEDGKKHVAMANDDDECYVQFFTQLLWWLATGLRC